MKKILIVEDERPIADILQFNLEKEGYHVTCVHDGMLAVTTILSEPPDLILLDLMLPGIDGIEVCRQVRQKIQTPIIMLTAKDSEIDKVLGLELGADDYITKPFSNRELLARIKALFRRTQHTPLDESQLTVGELLIDTRNFVVTKRETSIDLTQREFELLLYMTKHVGQVLTREGLLQSVWRYDHYGDLRTVDVTIRRLREKIEEDPGTPRYIITRRGIGYMLRSPSR